MKPSTRTALPILLTLAAAPATGPTTKPVTKPATRPTVVFNSDEGGFKLRVPAGWIVPRRPDAGQVFTVWMPLKGGVPSTRPAGPAARVRVGGAGLRVEQGQAGIDDGAALRNLTGLMAANLFADEKLGAKHVALRPAKVANYPARQVRFVIDQGQGPVTVVYVIAVHKGVEYVFNAAAPADQFDALWPDLAAMCESFELRE